MYDLRKMFSQIKDFNKAFGFRIEHTPTLIPEKEACLNFRLMEEENEEYLDASKNHDLVETGDSLGDQLYVLLGTIVKNGMEDQIVDIFGEIHLSNMSKMENGEVLKNSDGKVVKGKNYFKPNIKSILDKAKAAHLEKCLIDLEEGFVISVGDKFVVDSESNSGWALSDYPCETVPTEWLAMGLIDDVALSYDISTILYETTSQLRERLLNENK